MHLIDSPAPERPAGGCQNPPSPNRIFDTLLFSHVRAEALKAAIEFDVFTAIAEGWRTTETLAERCKVSERGVRSLCDFLVVNAFLTKSNDAYDLTLDSRIFLDRRSPGYVGGMAQFMASRANADAVATLSQCVRDGLPALGSSLTDEERWVVFAREMLPMSARAAAAVAGALGAEKRESLAVLDISASHGEYGLAVLRQNPRARLVGIDSPKVIAVARARAEAENFGERYHALAGDVFERALGGPYDLVLLPNFLHNHDVGTCESLLRKIHSVLAPGGRLAIVEFVPGEDRVAPPFPAMFSLLMLATGTGDAYTFAELDGMLQRNGFRAGRTVALPSPQTLVIAERA